MEDILAHRNSTVEYANRYTRGYSFEEERDFASVIACEIYNLKVVAHYADLNEITDLSAVRQYVDAGWFQSLRENGIPEPESMDEYIEMRGGENCVTYFGHRLIRAGMDALPFPHHTTNREPFDTSRWDLENSDLRIELEHRRGD